MSLSDRLPVIERPGAPLFDLGRLLAGDRSRNEARIRSLCHVAYLGGTTALARALGRYKIYVDTDDHGLSPHIMLDGYWEMWITEVIARHVGRGMVVADIGANIGYYTLLMAELVGPTGRVHSFEPNPAIADRLRRSIAINGFAGWTHAHNVALGDENGRQMAFVIPPNEPKNAYLAAIDGDLPEGSLPMPVQRIDSRADWSAIELAKIDVEGAEQIVWAGARGLLNEGKLKTVILEFTGGRYADAGAFLEELLAPGFRLSTIDPRRGVLQISRKAVLEHDPREDIILLMQR